MGQFYIVIVTAVVIGKYISNPKNHKYHEIFNYFTLLFLTLASWAQPLPKLFKKLSKSVVFIDVVSYDYSNLIYNQTVGEEESLGSGV